MIKRFLLFALILLLLIPSRTAQAQTATPPVTPAASPELTPTPVSGPVYIIQSGDSLSTIASRFGISLNDLMSANNITDPNNISAGAQVIIPGLEGISGVLGTELIDYGDTLTSLGRRFQVDTGFLRKLNHITSPSELYAGVGLVLPQKQDGSALTRKLVLAPGESLLEAAVRENSDPWTIARVNNLAGTWDGQPGDVLYEPGESASTGKTPSNGLPSAFLKIKVDPLPMIQGGTSEINIQTGPGVTLAGTLVYMPLHFFPMDDGSFTALQGIYAMLEPGPYPLRVEATLPDGTKQSFEQMVVVQSGYYPNDPLLLVEADTIDPAVTEPELKQIVSLTAPASPVRHWSGIFQSPSYFNDCFTSRYGNRRTYLGSGTEQKIYSFHSGLDFCGGEGLPISAPADGVVIFAGPLTVRGNATIIDHGWGVYTGIWHQSEIKVTVGQEVKKGDVIGAVGGTGRVTGAHLHWEVWVNGIQVNPMDWLNNIYP
ncbi:MAG TPA: peptidoglycan DD-metalloendopeptidase family protein [Anaerolineales bacterium]